MAPARGTRRKTPSRGIKSRRARSDLLTSTLHHESAGTSVSSPDEPESGGAAREPPAYAAIGGGSSRRTTPRTPPQGAGQTVEEREGRGVSLSVPPRFICYSRLGSSSVPRSVSDRLRSWNMWMSPLTIPCSVRTSGAVSSFSVSARSHGFSGEQTTTMQEPTARAPKALVQEPRS